MNKENYKIHIIGAGISGLVAAKVLEDKGYSPVIIEATDRVGGRIKTDIINGYQLDHGFQVLLTSYPEAKKYLDFKTLKLQKLLPGAAIFADNKMKVLGDPLRYFKFLMPTLLFNEATILDKIKIFKLSNLLKKKTINQIFKDNELSSLEYLKEFGFSNKFIENFFKPFFSGIYLEPNLKTSSRMFEFVYKMFNEGYASIPKSGMEAIPKQLKNQLKRTLFIFNKKVKYVKDGNIVFKDNSSLKSHFTIITSDPSKLIPDLDVPKTQWKSCDTLYFETNKRIIEKPLIGLVPDKAALINNIFYTSCIKTSVSGNNELISVTIVKDHNLVLNDLINEVQKELRDICGIDKTTFLKHYSIIKALPEIKNIIYKSSKAKMIIDETIFLAGDIHLNGSLNAAMSSGEKAAKMVIQKISKISK
jgi:protoporphyrinogen oxidase